MMLTACLLLQLAACAVPQPPWESYADFKDINQLATDSAGRTIYGATNGGTFRFAAADTTLLGHATNLDGLPRIEASCVAVAPDGRTWIGTTGGGIGWFSSAGGAAGVPINGDAGLRSDTILALLYYRSGTAERVVAGMPGGLALIDAADGSVLRNFYQSQGYPVRRAVKALALRHDSLWVGTDSGVAVAPMAGIYAAANWTSYTTIAGLSPDIRSLFATDTMIVAGTVNGAARWLSGPTWQRCGGIGGP
ncbi:MAG TPA: hypothetical protein VMF29_04430, partial [Candidatus Edwardsbacteria bacterium]|nr:hypothetical protein [Candidatus Edwardsbacteria bacterium]